MKRIIKKARKKIGPLLKVWNWLLNHFFIVFFTLYILTTGSIFFKQSLAFSFIFGAIMLIYTILFLIYRIRINVTKLLHHELRFKDILTAYISFVIFTILLFSIIYWVMTMAGVGYLRYGECIDTGPINSGVIHDDPNLVTKMFHYPYFSADTFFTVGYGDICPMGANKIVAVLNAMIGNLFTVLILAIAITNYVSSKKDNGNKK